MNIDSFLGWFVDHVVLLIQVLVLLILGSVSWVLFRSVMSGKDEPEASGPSLGEIEKTLRKVLDNTTLKSSPEVDRAAAGIVDSDLPPSLQTPSTASPGATAGQASVPTEAQKAEVANLQQELQKRETSLKDLQKSLEEAKAAVAANGGAAAPGVDIKAMEEKIKELQAKLAEYEIIEDDIANLSTYKSENAKLKSELEGLKGKLGSKVAETGGPSDNVKQFAALMGAEAPPVVPAPKEGEAAPPAAPAPVEATPVATAPVEPAPVAVPAPAAEQALGVQADADKLLAETKDLPDAPPATPVAGEGPDQGQKLINEFEDFMKGS